MHDTAPVPSPPPEVLPPQSGITSALPPSSGSGRPPGVVGRCVRTAFAVPCYLIRHPLRSLAIGGLLSLILVGLGVVGVYLWASHERREARAAIERYHTDDAYPHLRVALAIWPRDPETLLLAARGARRKGAFDDADRFLDQYQDVRGNDDRDLSLERVLLRLERGELDSVSKYCQTLVERDDPASPLILEASAKGCLRMYRPQQGQAFLQEWLKRQPDNPQALLIQGQFYELLNGQHDAIASYREALHVDPELDEARLRLCSGLMGLGLTSEAQPHLEYLHRRFPDNLMVQVLLARVYDRAGEPEKAAALVESVLARQPHFAPALVERGKYALRNDRNEEAERALREAVTLEPGDFQAHHQLYLCLEKLGKSDDAQKEQERMQQIEDDLKTIQQISTVKMQKYPHDPELHYQAGMIALRAGSIGEALRWFQSALREHPHHIPTHKALAEHYQRIGDFARAREHRQQAGLSEAPAGDAKRP
jgi:Flp pilus assembly protein TadD